MESSRQWPGLGRKPSSEYRKGTRNSPAASAPPPSSDQQQQVTRTLARDGGSDPQTEPIESLWTSLMESVDDESKYISMNGDWELDEHFIHPPPPSHITDPLGLARPPSQPPCPKDQMYGMNGRLWGYTKLDTQPYFGSVGDSDPFRQQSAFMYSRDLGLDDPESLSSLSGGSSRRSNSSSDNTPPENSREMMFGMEEEAQIGHWEMFDIVLTPPISGQYSSADTRESVSFNPPPDIPTLPAAGVVSSAPSASSGSVSSQGDETEDARTASHRTESNSHSEASESPSTSSSSSDYEGSTAGPKQALLERLMDHFYFIISNCPVNRPCRTSHGPTAGEQRQEPSHSGTQGSASGTSAAEKGKQNSRKRKGDDGGDDGEDQRSPKVPKLNDHPDGADLRLACPFFKRNPARHRRGACTGPGWPTVHRVKEHIYRNHALPITCPRCHEEFADDRLRDSHLRASEQCEVRDQAPAVEGIDSTQKELLRCRRRAHKHMAEADKWCEMYTILFPDANPTRLPSPYYEYPDGSPESEFSRYEQFLRRELPSQVQRRLEVCIEERLSPVEEGLRSELVDIIRDAQIHLFDAYRALRSSAPEAAPGGEAVEAADAEGVARARSEQSHRVEDDLQAFYQPPPLVDGAAGSLDDFDGLLFGGLDGSLFGGFDGPLLGDFAAAPGSVALDSGYWSVAPAGRDEKEPVFMDGELGG
ncbi:hypothetical protein LX36DRAFT_754048 [Colletotrichum falcatum]|nr:hypothetical protein LX36DRAFT_754048 [Colletotrichum falcatum]